MHRIAWRQHSRVASVVCPRCFFAEAASSVILSEASLRAESKDLTRSSARQATHVSYPGPQQRRVCEAFFFLSSRASLRVEGPRILMFRDSRDACQRIGVLRLAQRSLRMTEEVRTARTEEADSL